LNNLNEVQIVTFLKVELEYLTSFLLCLKKKIYLTFVHNHSLKIGMNLLVFCPKNAINVPLWNFSLIQYGYWLQCKYLIITLLDFLILYLYHLLHLYYFFLFLYIVWIQLGLVCDFLWSTLGLWSPLFEWSRSSPNHKTRQILPTPPYLTMHIHIFFKISTIHLRVWWRMGYIFFSFSNDGGCL